MEVKIIFIPGIIAHTFQKQFKTSSWLVREKHSHLSEMNGEFDGTKPVEQAIHRKLTDSFSPVHLDIMNESYMHNVPRGSETHFKVIVVSSNFDKLPLIKRHRLVNDILKDELKNGVHALSITAKTPAEWDSSSKQICPSPACRGGFGK
ncbi:bolA-like protein DDB_G0274169 isoform X2 [Periplaneta americana]|uniref:bolA-like protein DDB_G0274169 isoform X2 n=1 Tax=Periplaneta americana TaxID=6978 RepID=UPI0037E818E9